jgi:hypothetical protein
MNNDNATNVKVEDMYQLGVELFQKGDKQGAADWWEKATAAGRVTPARNLARAIYANGNSGMADPQKFLRVIKKLAYELNCGWSMVVLGTIYCGFPYGFWTSDFDSDSFVNEINPPEGIKLLDKGIETSASPDSDLELNADDYTAASAGYYWCVSKASQGEDERYDTRSINVNLKKAVKFIQIAIKSFSDDAEGESKKDIAVRMYGMYEKHAFDNGSYSFSSQLDRLEEHFFLEGADFSIDVIAADVKKWLADGTFADMKKAAENNFNAQTGRLEAMYDTLQLLNTSEKAEIIKQLVQRCEKCLSHLNNLRDIFTRAG